MEVLARGAGGAETRGPQRCTIAIASRCADKLAKMLENPVGETAPTGMVEVWRR